MRLSGLSLFILLSLLVHGLGAWLLLDAPQEFREERGAGATALEVGSLFNSVAQDAVEPTRVEEVSESQRPVDPVEPVEPREVVAEQTRPAVEQISAQEMAAVTPDAVLDSQLQDLTANDALDSPDIVKPEAIEPVDTDEAEVLKDASVVAPRQIVEESKIEPDPVKTVEARPVQATAQVIERLPQPKARPPAPKRVAAKPAEKQQKARKATVASRKGGSVANSKGRAGATGGNGGRSTTSNGDALTSNYKGKVRSEVARKKRYPNAARRRGETGTAVIRFVVARNGAMSGLQLVRSSGSDTLDKAALKMAQRAAPFPDIPAGTGKSQIRFTLPVSFSR